MILADEGRNATDWNRYYSSVPLTARLTRKYTAAVLLEMIQRYARPAVQSEGLSIVELGGANSCFLDRIFDTVPCASYDIVDTNQYGLSLTLRSRHAQAVRLHNASVLALPFTKAADLVFSAGLIEHFHPEDTRKAVSAHLDLVRPGGTLILTFPTPTVIYQSTRRLLEACGQWEFPDERPLALTEVVSGLNGSAQIVYTKVLWPLLLTQQVLVARKA
jgi:SAM-dependent methyltransferase